MGVWIVSISQLNYNLRHEPDVTFSVKHSSHFLQAHSLLNLHIIHSSQSSQPSPHAHVADDSEPIRRPHSSTDAIHPGLGPAGFRSYSNTINANGPLSSHEDRATAIIAGYYSAD